MLDLSEPNADDITVASVRNPSNTRPMPTSIAAMVSSRPGSPDPTSQAAPAKNRVALSQMNVDVNRCRISRASWQTVRRAAHGVKPHQRPRRET